MQLQSARDLKQEVLETLVQPFVTASLAQPQHVAAAGIAAHAGVALAAPLAVAAGSPAPRHHRSIALGIAPSGTTGFRLAVRLQRQGLMGSRLIEELVAKAHGEADVRLIGRVDKRAPLAHPLPWVVGDVRPLVIGASMAHRDVTAGTLGAFVRQGSRTCVLSNNHVLANENVAHVGDPILQRSTLDGGTLGTQQVAVLADWVPLQMGFGSNREDAAIAELMPGVAFDPGELRGLGGSGQRLAGVAPLVGGLVHKIGRTTGITTGRITAIEVDNVVVGYDRGNARFDGAVEIESAGPGPFSDGGDSGSLIVDENWHAVALLFAGSDAGGSNGLGVTYANPIDAVLGKLGATLIT